MTKGSYDFQYPHRPKTSSDDTKWKSCTCAILIIATICALILLLTLPWRNVENYHKDYNDKNAYEHYNMDKTSKFEKIVKIDDDKNDDDDDDTTNNYKSFHSTENDEFSVVTETFIEKYSKDAYRDIDKYSTESDEFNVVTEAFIDKNSKDAYRDIDEYSTKINLEYSTDSKEIYYEREISTGKNDDYMTSTIEDINLSTTETSVDISTEYTFTEKYPHIIDSSSTIDNSIDKSTETLDSMKTISYSTHLVDTSTEIYDRTTKVSVTEKSALGLTVTDNDTVTSTEAIKYKTKIPEYITKTSIIYARTEALTSTPKSKEVIMAKTSKPIFVEIDPKIKSCDSTICKTQASKILSLMNHHNDDECDDFYSYSCNGINSNYLIQPNLEADVWRRIGDEMDKISTDSKDSFLRQFKAFYDSCYDFDPQLDKASNVLSFQQMINSIGNFYDTSTVDTDIPSLSELLAALLKKDFPVLFDIGLEVDRKKLKYYFNIKPTTHISVMNSLIEKNYYSEECIFKYTAMKPFVDAKEVYEKYKECIVDYTSYIKTTRAALEYVNAFSECPDREKLINETLETLENDILRNMQLLSPVPENLNMAIKKKNDIPMSHNNLADKLPTFNWNDIYDALSIYPDNKYKIHIYSLTNLINIINTINELDSRKRHNAILAIYVHSQYREYILYRRESHEKRLHCLKLSAELMSDVSSLLYLDNFDSKNLAKKGLCPIQNTNGLVKKFFDIIKSALISEVQRGSILADDMKNIEAEKKLSALRLITISNSDAWTDITFLKDRYSLINMTKDFLSNTIILQERNRELMYNSLFTDALISNNIWTYLSLPYDTSIKADTTLNILVIPMGAVEYLRKFIDSPEFLLMADIGFKLAKEISYILEASNIKVFTENRESESNELIININDNFNKQTVLFNITGKLYETERITDCAGAKMAIIANSRLESKSFHEERPLIWLNKTQNQLFFMYLTQQFCTKVPISQSMIGVYEEFTLPPLIRFNSLVANLPYFIDAFNCNSTMQGSIMFPLSEGDRYTTGDV